MPNLRKYPSTTLSTKKHLAPKHSSDDAEIYFELRIIDGYLDCRETEIAVRLLEFGKQGFEESILV